MSFSQWQLRHTDHVSSVSFLVDLGRKISEQLYSFYSSGSCLDSEVNSVIFCETFPVEDHTDTRNHYGRPWVCVAGHYVLPTLFLYFKRCPLLEGQQMELNATLPHVRN